MSVGHNIMSARRFQRLTQVELAKRAGISRSYLAGVETDRYNPSLDTLTRIADALHTSPNYLTGYTQTLLQDNPLLSTLYNDHFAPSAEAERLAARLGRLTDKQLASLERFLDELDAQVL